MENMIADSGLLRLGVIGLSEGNGHPFSWSAICNGYDAEQMKSCPFPVIPEYLSRQRFPQDSVEQVKVTHVWTQDRSLSEHIAAATFIPHVVDSYRDMVGRVDAVLLARDDAELHLEMSAPFLEAGLPIYIDKPIANTLRDLGEMFRLQKYPGQIFSCSALRYSKSLQLDDQVREELGDIRHVAAVVPKMWEKYGVHVLDPILRELALYGIPCEIVARRLEDVHVVIAKWPNVSAAITATGMLPSDIRLRYFGTKGVAQRVFDDTFLSFKRALDAFVGGAKARTEVIKRSELESVVSILERGAQCT